jgi:hypothetical protein
VCWAFAAIEDGVLVAHEMWRGDASRQEADQRREWFNAHGW